MRSQTPLTAIQPPQPPQPPPSKSRRWSTQPAAGPTSAPPAGPVAAPAIQQDQQNRGQKRRRAHSIGSSIEGAAAGIRTRQPMLVAASCITATAYQLGGAGYMEGMQALLRLPGAAAATSRAEADAATALVATLPHAAGGADTARFPEPTFICCSSGSVRLELPTVVNAHAWEGELWAALPGVVPVRVLEANAAAAVEVVRRWWTAHLALTAAVAAALPALCDLTDTLQAWVPRGVAVTTASSLRLDPTEWTTAWLEEASVGDSSSLHLHPPPTFQSELKQALADWRRRHAAAGCLDGSTGGATAPWLAATRRIGPAFVTAQQAAAARMPPLLLYAVRSGSMVVPHQPQCMS